MLGQGRWLVIGVAIVVGACGSSGESLFGSGSGDDDSGDGVGGSQSSNSADTSAPSANASSTQAAVGQGGGAVTSSASGDPGSGAGPPDQTSLACGNAQCPVGGDNACCHDAHQFLGDPQTQCITGPIDMDNCNTAETANGGPETRIECQLPEHCAPGQICCGARAQVWGQTVYVNVTCQSQCEWSDVVLCDPQAPVCPMVQTDGGMMVQTECVDSTLLPDGYFVCGV